jgi:hypothetical protein
MSVSTTPPGGAPVKTSTTRMPMMKSATENTSRIRDAAKPVFLGTKAQAARGARHRLPCGTAWILKFPKFPERRNEFAKLRAEIEEMRKTVSVRAEAA